MSVRRWVYGRVGLWIGVPLYVDIGQIKAESVCIIKRETTP